MGFHIIEHNHSTCGESGRAVESGQYGSQSAQLKTVSKHCAVASKLQRLTAKHNTCSMDAEGRGIIAIIVKTAGRVIIVLFAVILR